MNGEEIEREFGKVWGAIRKLEGKHIQKSKQNSLKSKNLSGISKDVNELIENDFFNTPKSIKEVISELKRRGFFGQRQRVDSIIRNSFFKSKKLLDRVNDKGWKYFKKK